MQVGCLCAGPVQKVRPRCQFPAAQLPHPYPSNLHLALSIPQLYLFKVLKQVHPDTGISSKAMAILNRWAAGPASRLPAGLTVQK